MAAKRPSQMAERKASPIKTMPGDRSLNAGSEPIGGAVQTRAVGRPLNFREAQHPPYDRAAAPDRGFGIRSLPSATVLTSKGVAARPPISVMKNRR